MRRLVLVLTLVVVLVPLAAATSQAGIVACNTNPCFGSDNEDNLWEQRGRGVDDEIWAKADDDWLQGQTYTDDRDTLIGGKGNDEIWANDGYTKDEIYGGLGRDTCYVDDREKHIEGCEITKGLAERPFDRNVIVCQTRPCYGVSSDEIILEQWDRGTDDEIYARGGWDTVIASRFIHDEDVVYAGPGKDWINVEDGDKDDRIVPPAKDDGVYEQADFCLVDDLDEAQSPDYVTLHNLRGLACVTVAGPGWIAGKTTRDTQKQAEGFRKYSEQLSRHYYR